MNSKRVSTGVFLAFLTLFMFFAALFGGRSYLPAFAATKYSSALDDLQKDETFNANDYPDSWEVTSIYVIQLAESEDGELFIYTYQPRQKTKYLVATEINMSLSESAEGTKLYNLTLLSCDGVLCKYLVKDFSVKSDKIRYYNISSIYCDYNDFAGGPAGGEYNAKAFEVAQFWTAVTANGTVYYSHETVDVITITGCTYGSIRVPDGYNFWYSTSRDMHIIAFNTDIKIDKLLEADVAFKYSEIDSGIYDNVGDDFAEWHDKTVTVTYLQKGTAEGSIFGSGPKTWDKIQTSSNFLKTLSSYKIELPKEKESEIKDKEWVLAFYDTDYTSDVGGVFGWLEGIAGLFGEKLWHYTKVKDATVIRLQFIKDGVSYNLGAVSNKTGEFDKVGGEDDTFWGGIEDKVAFWDKIPWWAWILIAVAALAIVLPILSVIFPVVGTVLKVIFKVLGKGLAWFFSALWWLICLPFRGIAALVKKTKSNRETKSKQKTRRAVTKRRGGSKRKA